MNVDELLWQDRDRAHRLACAWPLSMDADARFWLAYGLVHHPGWRGSVEPTTIGAAERSRLIAIGRELSELHLHWRTTGGWPADEPIPGEALRWRIHGVAMVAAVQRAAPDDDALVLRMARVAVQTVRRIEQLDEIRLANG